MYNKVGKGSMALFQHEFQTWCDLAYLLLPYCFYCIDSEYEMDRDSNYSASTGYGLVSCGGMVLHI